MKSIAKYLIIVATAALTACGEKTDEIQKMRQGETVVRVNVDDCARTSLSPQSVEGSRKVLWSEGDRICINGEASDSLPGSYAGGSSAVFHFDKVLVTPYDVLYPASAYSSGNEVLVPHVQKAPATPGSFGEGADIMLGRMSGSGVTLQHAFASLLLTIKKRSDAHPIAYVSFRGNDGEQVSGPFAADYANAALVPQSTAEENLTVKALCGMPATEEGIDVVIVVPSANYKKGFTVTVVDTEGHAMEKVAGEAKTIEKGTFVIMPAFEFVPTKTIADISINGASDLVQFAKDWNKGVYASEEGDRKIIAMNGDANFDATAAAAFSATGGIGSEDFPFNGEFRGNNHKISGLTSSSPLFGVIAAEGVVNKLDIAANCTFKCPSSAVGTLRGKMENCSDAAGVTLAPASQEEKVYAGGMVDLCDGGCISDCTFKGYVKVTLKSPCKDVRMGGIAARLTGETSIIGCSNEGSVHLDGTAVKGEESGKRSKNTEAVLGGIAATCEGCSVIDGCVNGGEVKYEFSTATKINQRPSKVGGIVGLVTGPGTCLSGCINSGDIYNYNFCNSDTFDLAVIEGGIVAAAKSEGEKIIISSCKCMGHNTLQTQRGVQGGIVGWAVNAVVTDCTSEITTAACNINIPFSQGGIAGKCENVKIEGGIVNGVTLNNKVSAGTRCGAVAGILDAGSAVISCEIINARIARNGTTDFYAGAVAGSCKDSASEISGCTVDAYRSIDSGTTWMSFTLDGICAEGSFIQKSPNVIKSAYYNIAGHVRCGLSPLEGVVVSDGLQSVVTDKNGFFSMDSDLSDVRWINVCDPEGYASPTEDGLPKFFRKVNNTSLTNIDFNLEKIDGNPSRYTMIYSADPQPRSSGAGYDKIGYHSLNCSDDLYTDIGASASGISGRKVYGMVLGDVTHNDVSLIPRHREFIKNHCSGMTTYHVIGNHDYKPSATNLVAGCADFENAYGPVHYSVNIGKIHYIILDDLIMNYTADGLKDYSNGLSDDVMTWLRGDLNYVDANTPIVICTHGPMFMKYGGGTGYSHIYNSSRHGPDYTALLSRYKKVYSFAGHIHNAFTYIFSVENPNLSQCRGVECYTLPRSTGALWLNEYICHDGSPRGYVVVDVNGTSMSWKFTPAIHQTSSFAGSTLPSYSGRDYTFQGGVAKIDGITLSDSYQMKVYPGITFNGKKYIMANIFWWDARWSKPVLKYKDNSGQSRQVTLEKWGVSSKVYDFDYETIRQHYIKYNSNWRNEETNSDGTLKDPTYTAHMFRCTLPTDGTSGEISVTDRFGNTFVRQIKW